MSKGRTIKRNSIQIDPDDYGDLNEQYFNFASFGGINTNKNYVSVNQYSFEDANNVYVDQNNQLSTRPPIKSVTIDYLIEDEKIVDIQKVNNILFYKTRNFNGEVWVYSLIFKVESTWYNMQLNGENPKTKVIFINDYYFIMVEGPVPITAFKVNLDGSISGYESSETIYVPITKIVQGTSEIENESKNLLTTSEIARYLFEHDLNNTINTEKLINNILTVTIGNDKYEITFQQGNQIVFASKVMQVEIPLDSYSYNTYPGSHIHYSNQGENGKIMIDYREDNKNKFYLSLDGELYSKYTFPVHNSLDYCCTISDDGLRIFYSTMSLYVINNERYIRVYYADLDGINISSWNSFDQLIGTIENGIYKNSESNIREIWGTGSVGYSSKRNNGAYSVTASVCHAPDKSNAVFVARVSQSYVCYNYTDDNTIYQDNNSGNTTLTTGNFSKPVLVFIVFKENINTNEIETYGDFSTVALNGIEDGQTISDYSDYTLHPYRMFADVVDLSFVRYVVTNSLNIIVLGANVTYLRFDGVNIVRLNESNVFYSAINNNNYLYSIGALLSSEDYNDYYNNERYCVIERCYFKAMYRFMMYGEQYRNSDVDNNQLTFTPNYAYRINYVNGSLSLTFVYNTQDVLYGEYGYCRYSVIFGNLNLVPNLASNRNTYVTNKYTYTGNITSEIIISYNRYNYPYCINGHPEYTLTGNYQTRFVERTVNTISEGYLNDVGNMYIMSDGQDILSDKWYYHNNTIYPLLSNNINDVFYPLYVSNDGSYFVYYNSYNNTIYTNNYEGYATIDVLNYGSLNYIIPDFFENFITSVITIGDKLYQSQTRFDNDDRPLLYFPIDSEVKFIDNITNLVVFSQTSLGVFLENFVYEYQYSTDNEVFTLTPTKLQLGCKEGADILVGYDGSTIFMTQLKGVAGLTYADFVQSTEQVYNYLSDNIMDLYDSFKSDEKIKLYQYKYWLFMYKQDLDYLYLLDTRTSTWWKWTLPYNPQVIVYDNIEDKLKIVLNGQITEFDFDNEEQYYFDYIGTEIEWYFKSQKIHFGAPNNYKHIRQVNVITTQSGNELRYKLKFTNYRNLNNLSDTDTVDFEINQLSTLIKRVSFMKTNAFQFEISNDETNHKPTYFETPDIAIKYRITERVR